MKRSILWTICVSILFLMGSCQSEEEKDNCSIYCETMSDCYEVLDQPFSYSSCRRDCYDNLERYSSVGCESRYLDLVDCKIDLSCSDANNVSEDCAPEVDDLVRCVE